MAELNYFSLVRELLHMIGNVRIPADLAKTILPLSRTTWPLIGSVCLIARAKRENLIPFAKPAIDKLISVGLYIDPEVIVRVLRAIGEHPVH